MSEHKTIPLKYAGKGNFRRSKSIIYESLWMICEVIFIYNPLQPSSQIRAFMLNLFGAEIGKNVIIRPRVKIKFPWLLKIGDNSWIGEEVWIHNQERLTIGRDTVISQGTFITTGSHEFRTTMDLEVAPVIIGNGVWITSKCIVLKGIVIEDNVLLTPGSLANRSLSADMIYAGNPAKAIKNRWESPVETK